MSGFDPFGGLGGDRAEVRPVLGASERRGMSVALKRLAREHAKSAASIALDAHESVLLARAQQVHQPAEAVLAFVETRPPARRRSAGVAQAIGQRCRRRPLRQSLARCARSSCLTLRTYIGHRAVVALLRIWPASLTPSAFVPNCGPAGGSVRRARPVALPRDLPGLEATRRRARGIAAGRRSRFGGAAFRPARLRPRSRRSAPPSRCGRRASAARALPARASRRSRGTTRRRSCAPRTSSRVGAACS